MSAAVAGGDVADLLDLLVGKSLVQFDPAAGRYQLLESVRQFAREQLSPGDKELAQARHQQYYAELAEEAEPGLQGAIQAAWLQRLEAERENLRAALQTAAASSFASDLGLRTAGALARFWYIRGYLREGSEWLRLTLAATEGPPSHARARALNGAGGLALEQGDLDAATRYQELNLAACRALGDRAGTAGALGNLGLVALGKSDFAGAHSLISEGLTIRRDMGDRWGVALALNNLGITVHHLGRWADAIEMLEESLAFRRQLNDLAGIAQSLNNLGIALFEQGDVAASEIRHREALIIQGDLGERRGMVTSLDELAALAAACGDLRRAARLWGACESLREQIGAPLSQKDQPRYRRLVAEAQAASGDAAEFEQDWAEGRCLALEEAVAYALEHA